VAIVVQAVIRIGFRVLKNWIVWLIAAGAFGLIFFGNVPFPFIIIGAAVLGFAGARFAPKQFAAGNKAEEEHKARGQCC